MIFVTLVIFSSLDLFSRKLGLRKTTKSLSIVVVVKMAVATVTSFSVVQIHSLKQGTKLTEIWKKKH